MFWPIGNAQLNISFASVRRVLAALVRVDLAAAQFLNRRRWLAIQLATSDVVSMIKDRYAKMLFSEGSLAVFDIALNYDSELLDEIVGWRLRDFHCDKYSTAYEVDFGAGADWPMVAYEVLGLIPYSAVAAIFFMGDRIEKSVLSWKRMASTLRT